MMYENIALIYIPNDHRASFQCDDPAMQKDFEEKKSVITRLYSYYSWLLDRGTFYKVYMDSEAGRLDLERIIGFLSALDIPAFVVRDFAEFIPVDIPSFDFEKFSRHLLPIWFSSKMSNLFDYIDVITGSDFCSCPIHFCANLKVRCVNEFDTFSRFEERVLEFLFTYKGIESKRFYNADDEEDLSW